MKLRNTSAYLFSGLVLAACSGAGYQLTDDGMGVVVSVDQAQPTEVRKVRVEVMGEKLFHVSATPERKFSESPSLIVVPQKQKTDFKINEKEDEIVVETSQVSAVVSRTTGQVRFFDAQGNLILAEDSRTFRPIEVEGTKAYSVHETSITRERTRSFSSIIRRYLCLSSYQPRIMVYCGTVIRCAVSVIPVIIHSWTMYSSCMTTPGRRAL